MFHLQIFLELSVASNLSKKEFLSLLIICYLLIRKIYEKIYILLNSLYETFELGFPIGFVNEFNPFDCSVVMAEEK